jgi:hypothetical protein
VFSSPFDFFLQIPAHHIRWKSSSLLIFEFCKKNSIGLFGGRRNVDQNARTRFRLPNAAAASTRRCLRTPYRGASPCRLPFCCPSLTPVAAAPCSPHLPLARSSRSSRRCSVLDALTARARLGCPGATRRCPPSPMTAAPAASSACLLTALRPCGRLVLTPLKICPDT